MRTLQGVLDWFWVSGRKEQTVSAAARKPRGATEVSGVFNLISGALQQVDEMTGKKLDTLTSKIRVVRDTVREVKELTDEAVGGQTEEVKP